MNWDKIEGNWKQAKGKVQEQWAKLTDDHLESISGKRDRLVGKVQECYGIHKDVAEQQVKDWEGSSHDLFAEISAEVKKHTGIARQ